MTTKARGGATKGGKGELIRPAALFRFPDTRAEGAARRSLRLVSTPGPLTAHTSHPDCQLWHVGRLTLDSVVYVHSISTVMRRVFSDVIRRAQRTLSRMPACFSSRCSISHTRSIDARSCQHATPPPPRPMGESGLRGAGGAAVGSGGLSSLPPLLYYSSPCIGYATFFPISGGAVRGYAGGRV